MTQRTHDLAAVLLVSYRFLSTPLSNLNWETLLGIGVVTILGALTPDIDNVASPAWKNKLIPWENKFASQGLEGHRHLSHSLIGCGLFLLVAYWLLRIINLQNLNIDTVITAYAFGLLSHLLADSLTVEGVPWLFPIPWHLGFPPFRFLRIKTGGWIEKLVVFPLLLILTLWVYYNYRHALTSVLRNI